MMENKQLICDLLLKALQATRNGADVIAMKYSNDKEVGIEIVEVYFGNGAIKTVDVTADSGTAIIKDILKCF